MPILPSIQAVNTILYCRRWRETVDFYQRRLHLPVTFASSWFVEFRLSDGARLSVADERRASIKSAGGGGMTITLQVQNADAAWLALQEGGIAPGPVKDHAWGARVFYFADPEGHRLEVWSSA
ncbi:MAG: VOC family protein [Gammaproteobacteria bacterium]|nr:VOC family protein [Gammaproteobacteria bacterium]NIR81816.1 VOC family protein [Gammaproteobacteria bacterium]NIR88648.1 VOC family protein [Gammaproteobacteria bacterium]NIU02924.1 VOC family protein [Gammaproteobacteria bacterium]NIV50445.1 VOC family protein [Gammaproteobacteria bacterium]